MPDITKNQISEAEHVATVGTFQAVVNGIAHATSAGFPIEFLIGGKRIYFQRVEIIADKREAKAKIFFTPEY